MSATPPPGAAPEADVAVPEAGVAVPPAGLVDRDTTEQEFVSDPLTSEVTAVDADEGSALVIGEALVDIVRRPGAPDVEHPGGSPANVALGLARLGRHVELLTSLGDDARGALVRDHLESAGVHLVPGNEAPPRTSTAIAEVDDGGVAQYTFDVHWALPSSWATPPAPPVVVHTGSIAAVLEPGASDVLHVLEARRDSATLTYDPNLRPSLMPPPEATAPVVERLVALADVVKVSDEDLAWLHPDEHPVEVARRWARSGPALVVVTRGADGVTAATATGHLVDVAAPTVEVADTVGAGDSFMSGLIDGLWSAQLLGASHRSALHAIDEATLRSVLARCVRIAAITVSRPGANPPTSAELDQAP